MSHFKQRGNLILFAQLKICSECSKRVRGKGGGHESSETEASLQPERQTVQFPKVTLVAVRRSGVAALRWR